MQRGTEWPIINYEEDRKASCPCTCDSDWQKRTQFTTKGTQSAGQMTRTTATEKRGHVT